MRSAQQRKRTLAVISIISVVLLFSLCCFAGCSSSQSSSTSPQPSAQVDPTDPTAPYTSDEACLACHGKTYEANAQNTAHYGIWNPHASIHGGYVSCDNCHEKGQELTKNWCANCHTYSAEGSPYYEEPLFLAPVK